MTSPNRYITRMLLFLFFVGVSAFLLYPPLETAFWSNPALNGLILSVLFIGILLNFRAVIVLRREIKWIDKKKMSLDDESLKRIRFLSPLALILKNNRAKGNAVLAPFIVRSVMDSVSMRLDEDRELSRYLIGLSTFLGLLGTFWGLMLTISSVGEVIQSLNVAGEDAVEMFNVVKQGLQGPLDGMGTAFSTSLLGLVGALILGFLDLQVSRGQNNFYNELDEFLATLTRYSSSVGAASDDNVTSNAAYGNALLEQAVESLSDMRVLLRRDTDNASMNDKVMGDILRVMMQIEADLARAEARSDARNEALLRELRDSFKLMARTVSGKEN